MDAMATCIVLSEPAKDHDQIGPVTCYSTPGDSPLRAILSHLIPSNASPSDTIQQAHMPVADCLQGKAVLTELTTMMRT